MPRRRPVKPFIDKKSSEHFSVVHRSQLDPKYYEDDASKFVLMSSKAKLSFPDGDGMDRSVIGGDAVSEAGGGVVRPKMHGRIADSGYDAASVAGNIRVKQLKVLGGSGGSVSGVRGIREISEVDDLGFAGAGYDYSRHMRDIGGGTYVSATGSVVRGGSVHQTHGAAARMDIPDDVLPSRPEDELERMLEAISLHPATLPRDIREAMDALDEEDEEEEDCEDEEAATVPAGVASTAVFVGSVVVLAADADARSGGPEAAMPVVALAKARAAVAAAGLEELDDEFVLQASGEAPVPEWVGGEETSGGDTVYAGAANSLFDFDAHIARLMAQADGAVVDSNDLDDEGDYDEDDDDEEGEEGEDGSCAGGEARRAGRSALRRTAAAAAAAAASVAAPHAGSRINGDLLSAILQQYGDDDIGELDDDDPRLTRGGWHEQGGAPSGLRAAAAGANGAGHDDADDDDEEEEEDSDSEATDESDDDDASDEEEEEGGADGSEAGDDDGGPASAAARIARGTGGAEAGALSTRNRGMHELMDEFLREKSELRMEALLQRGVEVGGRARPPTKTRAAAAVGADGLPVEEEEEEPQLTAAQLAALATQAEAAAEEAALLGSGAASVDPAAAAAAAAEEDDDGVMPAGWTLEPKVRSSWDAATVISTYTNTEHRPRVLADGVSITSARTGFGPKRVAADSDAAAAASLDAASVGDMAPVAIRLSKKTGLPVGFAASLQAGRRPAKPLALINEHPANDGATDKQLGEAAPGDSDSESDGFAAVMITEPRVRGESKEVRTARKIAVKAERRDRRETKKSLRTAFKQEELRQSALQQGRSATVKGVVIL